MAAKKTPAFQFYPKDFLSSDSVSLMTSEQIGAYVLLLCHAWNNPDGLPSSPASLAKLARTGAQRFERSVWPMVIGQFYQGDGGRWFNDRLEQERMKQAEFRQSASRAGKRSAEQRAFNERSTPVDIPLQRPSNGNPTLQSSSSSSSSSSEEVQQQQPRERAQSLHGCRNLDLMTYGPISLWASQFRDVILPLVATHYGGDRDAADRPARAWIGELDAANQLTPPSPSAVKSPANWWREAASQRWAETVSHDTGHCTGCGSPDGQCVDVKVCNARWLEQQKAAQVSA